MSNYATICGVNTFDFNSRINLQAYCDSEGIKGHDFVRLPRFGWFAKEHKTGTITLSWNILNTTKERSPTTRLPSTG